MLAPPSHPQPPRPGGRARPRAPPLTTSAPLGTRPNGRGGRKATGPSTPRTGRRGGAGRPAAERTLAFPALPPAAPRPHSPPAAGAAPRPPATWFHRPARRRSREKRAPPLLLIGRKGGPMRGWPMSGGRECPPPPEGRAPRRLERLVRERGGERAGRFFIASSRKRRRSNNKTRRCNSPSTHPRLPHSRHLPSALGRCHKAEQSCCRCKGAQSCCGRKGARTAPAEHLGRKRAPVHLAACAPSCLN